MRIFLTGATGFIGSVIIPELIQAGHRVVGLARSDAAAEALTASGAEIHRGSLEDPESLQRGAAESDGVIHCAADHDVSNIAASCEKERQAIEALGGALAGSDRLLLITSGTGMGSRGPGQIATEDYFDANNPNPRVISEVTGAALAERGVKISVVRLPQVHDTIKQGLITYVIQAAREKGVSAYIGEGLNRWPATHVIDVARLYRLAFEKHEAGSRYNAVAEEGVPMREIAEAIGKGLRVPAVSIRPEEAPAHFSWLGMVAGYDMPASSQLTQQRLGWRPAGPGLIDDLSRMRPA